MIEILSPEQSQTHAMRNIWHDLQHGTQMGWLIDPVEQTGLAFIPSDQFQVMDAKHRTLPTPAFATKVSISGDGLFGLVAIR